MALQNCRECGYQVSIYATGCPQCGAHYTAALGTYHRGLVYSGFFAAGLWFWLLFFMPVYKRHFGSDVILVLKDVRFIMFVLSAGLLTLGFARGWMRRNALEQADVTWTEVPGGTAPTNAEA